MARISRKELKRDELVEATKGAEHWLVEHASTVIRAAVVVILLAAIAGGWYWIAQRNREAGSRLYADAQRRFEESQSSGFSDRAELETLAQDFTRASHKASGGSALLAAYYEGLVLHRLGRDEDAQKVLQGVVDDPDTSATLLGTTQALQAEIYHQQGNDDRAIEILQKLVTSDPPVFPVDQALLELGKIYRARGDEEAARTAWQRIVDEFPAQGASDEARRLLGS